MEKNVKSLWNIIFKDETIEAAVTMLLSFRDIQVKLSEINVDKHIFNYLKKKGVYGSIFNTDKGWHLFSKAEEYIVLISVVLYKYGINEETIKSIISNLLSDSLLNENLKSYLISKKNDEIFDYYKADRPNLYNYIFYQKGKNPNLPSVFNIEAILLLIYLTQKPVLLIVFENGNYELYTGLDEKASLDVLVNTECPFITIPLSALIKDLSKNNSIRNTKERLYFNEFSSNTNETPQLENIDANIKIENLIREYANQNILIKVRDSKKVLVQRLFSSKVKK